MPAHEPQTDRRRALILALLFIAALVPRLAYLAELQRSPLEDFLSLDTKTHHLMGLRIAETGATGEEVFFRAPLYPYAVGLFYHLFGPDRFPLRLAQALIGALAAPLTFLLGLRLAGRGPALAAGLLVAGSWVMIYFGGELLITTLLVPLDLLLLLLLIRDGREQLPGTWGLLAAGLVLGLSALARPNILIFLPAAVIWLGWRAATAGKLRSRAFVLPLLAFILGSALVVLPVTLRNMVKGGDPVLIASQGGINFFLGNNAAANGRAAMAPCSWAEIPGSYRQLHRESIWAHELIWVSGNYLAQRETGRTDLRPSEVSGYWFGRAGDFFLGRPGDALGLLARKVFFLLNAYEIPSNKDMEHFVQRTRLGTLNLLALGLPGRFPAGLVLPLALLGIGLSLGRWRRHLLFLLFLGSYSAGIVLFFVNARYRVPLLPLLFIYAALAVTFLIRRWRKGPPSQRLRRLALPLSTLLLLGLLCNLNLFDVRDPVLLGTLHFNLGNHHLNGERYDLAEQSYLEAVRLNPGLAEAWSNLGNLGLKRKDLTAAASRFSEAVRLAPENPAVHFQLGETLLRLNRLPQAAAALEQAARLNPAMTLARFRLAEVHHRRGDHQAAVRELREILRREPNNARARQLLQQLER